MIWPGQICVYCIQCVEPYHRPQRDSGWCYLWVSCQHWPHGQSDQLVYALHCWQAETQTWLAWCLFLKGKHAAPDSQALSHCKQVLVNRNLSPCRHAGWKLTATTSNSFMNMHKFHHEHAQQWEERFATLCSRADIASQTSHYLQLQVTQ